MINLKETPIRSPKQKENSITLKQRRKLMIPIHAKQKATTSFVDASGKGILSVSPKAIEQSIGSPGTKKMKFNYTKNQINFNS
mmetsp:Transcript_27118/g.23985  ORF Transcript_27118/g.23985 Transcript_27118/m.23985 type:complete len:83 (+) Transcript_27118:375-623(+)